MKRQPWLLLLLTMMFAVAASAQPSLQTLVTNSLSEPYGVAVDAKNYFYLTDSAHNRVVRYDSNAGVLTNLAGVYGESGRNDGPGVFARFFNPQGIVFARGGLVVADSGNHAIRFVTLDGTVSTLAGGTLGYKDAAGAAAQFNAPAGVAADAAGNIYIADLANNRIRKLDLANNVTTLAGTYLRPEAVAVDKASGTVYVGDTGNHTIKAISPAGVVSVFAGSGSRFISGSKDSLIAANALFTSPRGLLWVGGKTGLLVSDTGNSLIRRVYFNATFNTYSVETYLKDSALLAPIGIAQDNIGNFPLADLGANKLQSIQITKAQPPVAPPQIGYVIMTTNAFGQLRTDLVPVVNSTFNNDVKVAVLSERGTDTFYSLDPNANFPDDPSSRNTPQPYENGLLDWPFTIINPAVDGSNVVVRAIGTQDGRRSSDIVTARFQFKTANPVINGKSPGGFSMEDATENAQLWYTTDGSSPANGSPSRLYVPGTKLNIVNGTNDVVFKVRAFKQGYTPSAEVTKTFLYTDLETTSIGITRDFTAGIGATIVVPVDVKLAHDAVLRTLQFRVEVTPEGAAPAVSTQFRYLHISTNDFIQLPVVSDGPPLVESYTSGNATGLAISFIGNTNLFGCADCQASLEVGDIATVALVAVPIPPNAQAGQSYKVSVLYPSATSDARQASVNMTTFADRHITVTNTPYIVGDSGIAHWYNAGDFGNGNLNNNDVNNAFLAACGLFTPYPFSDVFDAMDSFPEDSSVAAGGDGQIRYLDWNVILNRSLRLPGYESNWSRSWSEGGIRTTKGATLNGLQSLPSQQFSNAGQLAWLRDGSLNAGGVENAKPGDTVSIPVYVNMKAGKEVKGLQFRALVTPNDGAPPLTQRVEFAANASLPTPVSLQGVDSRLPLNQVVGAWSLSQNSFAAPLKGKAFLGYVTFQLPASASSGQSYTVHFSNVDGSPDSRTQYDLESFAADVWVLSPALRPAAVLSDEWKTRFFGNAANPWSDPTADADGDGVTNLQEFLKGSQPTKLRFHNADSDWRTGLKNDGGFKLRWFAEPGKSYTVERSSNLGDWSKVAENVSGSGDVKEVTDRQDGAQTFFYRVRAQQ